jgi:UDP-N-acetyl-D-mannosaminuronate dehydrogenase
MTAGPGTGGSCVQNPWYLWYGSNSPSTTGQGGRARRR